MEWWLKKPGNEVFKSGTGRRLVVIVSDVNEFARAASEVAREFGVQDEGDAQRVFLRVLDHWRIRPHRVFRAAGKRARLDSSFDGGVDPTEAAEIELQDIRKHGDDFLDLTISGLFSKLPPANGGAVLSGFNHSEDARLTVLRIAGELYQLGYALDWEKIYPGIVAQVSLPTYPWRHQTCWLEAAAPVAAVSMAPKPAEVEGDQFSKEQAKDKEEVPRRQASAQSLAKVVALVTGIPVEEIRPEASPSDLGIDSLMTLEVQEELKNTFGVNLSSETLIKIASLRELERLINQALASTNASLNAAAELPQAKIAAPTGAKTSPEIREATFADYEQIASLTTRNGLGMKNRQEWERLWAGNPVYKKVPNWPIGWVVENGVGIVGFLGNIPISSHWKGREIVGASLHGFCMDTSHRGHGLLLLDRLQNSESPVQYVIGSTANVGSSKVLDRAGIARVPAGDWENAAFWITNYRGFLKSVFAKKQWPTPLSFPASAALAIRDKLLKRSWPQQRHQFRVCTEFDERFDAFWQELQRTYPHRFLSNRSRDVLEWHFKNSLAQNRTWVVAYEKDSRILACAIFQRCDSDELNLKRIRLIDFQMLDGDSEVLVSALAWALRRCQEEDIHMLEACGFRPEKQSVINRLAPHLRRLPSWLYYYKARRGELEKILQNPDVWDPSQFDGDATL